MPSVSIIIPVFNKWELTQICLKTLAKTTVGLNPQVIAVDNASSDVTPRAAPFLGERLFGENFLYIRNEKNRNFGPASNQGALAANGDFLLFLNNDTELLPDWLPPLFKDFEDFPDIAGTGPVLLYPKIEPIGYTVQHLGVCVSPFYSVFHLYEGIPARSQLTRKRRFFQVITGACLLMPKKIFINSGMFDERYKNGFEDIDLCARLKRKGYKFTVNPDARIVHYESQTPGRNDYDSENSALLVQSNFHLLKRDGREHVEADGMSLDINEWQRLMPTLPESMSRNLDALAPRLDFQSFLELAIERPYWLNGWQSIKDFPEFDADRINFLSFLAKLNKEALPAIEVCSLEIEANNLDAAEKWLNLSDNFSNSLDALVVAAKLRMKLCENNSEPIYKKQYQKWLENYETFNREKLEPFLKVYWRRSLAIRKIAEPQNKYAYAAWRQLIAFPARRARLAENRDKLREAQAVAIILTVTDPASFYLEESVRSIIDQDYENLEICLVAARSDLNALKNYAIADQRVRVLSRRSISRIEALNYALWEISSPWFMIVDQDDIVEKTPRL